MHTINEVAKTLGMSKSKLRFLEKKDLIIPKRDTNNYRVFDGKDILIIKYILVMQYAGMSIEEIREMLKIMKNEETIDILTEKVLQNKISEFRQKIIYYENVIELISNVKVIADGKYLEEEKAIDNYIEEMFTKI